jgi:hypothetical protein
VTWLWLVGTGIAGVAAYLIGWPTWSGFTARRRRGLNTDRYLAWRGRAGERPPVATLSMRDRGRLAVAGVLALVAVFCLVAYFTYA